MRVPLDTIQPNRFDRVSPMVAEHHRPMTRRA
jgi:hypothetical protein